MTIKHSFFLSLGILALAMPLFAACFPAQASSEIVAYTFKGSSADGAVPFSGLSGDSVGNGYGTTEHGGPSGAGTVYKITPSGKETLLYSFTGYTDGGNPTAGVTLGKDGNFYGTTSMGGLDSYGYPAYGTIYKLTPSGVLTTLYAFGRDNMNGMSPSSGLLQAKDGNFYGTTYGGGLNNHGTVYKITSGGILTTLYAFGSLPGYVDGISPAGGVIQGTDGNFYGTTEQGGLYSGSMSFGTVYKLTPGGVLTTLYSFTGAADGDGNYPASGVIEGKDGSFYGTTYYGGADGTLYGGYGTVYKLTPSGQETVLHSFTGGADGDGPIASLIQGKDGNFYGTTSYGDPLYTGAVYKMTPNGTLTVLHTFAGGADGSDPAAPLIQDKTGYLYGTTENGGSSGNGVIFRITL